MTPAQDELVAKLKTPEDCERFAINVEARGKPELARAEDEERLNFWHLHIMRIARRSARRLRRSTRTSEYCLGTPGKSSGLCAPGR